MKVLRSADNRHAVYFADARNMADVPSESVDLVITSPPYYLGMPYTDPDNPNPAQLERVPESIDGYHEYLHGLEPVWDEAYRAMRPGAYACINAPILHTTVKNFGSEQFVLGLSDDIMRYWRDALGAIYKARHLWKATRATRFMGGYPQPLEGCVMRDCEDIVVLRKPKGENYELTDERKARRRASSFANAKDWFSCYSEVWEFPGAQKMTTGGVEHPAPFPVELPKRCMRAYSVLDDVVLDPFLGTGTTIQAGIENGRKVIGYELEERFAPHILAKTKMNNYSLAEAF